MKAAIRAEFRKLFTVRSTYIMLALSLFFIVLFGFYIQGYRLTDAGLHDPNQITSIIIGAVNSLPVFFGSIIAILLVTHEYRYNTITYSLTASNSRHKVLAAKIIVMSVFGISFTFLAAALSPLLSYLGVHLHGHTLAPQIIPYASLFWRSLLFGWGSIMVALALAVLIRNQIGAIVSLFIIPQIEQLLSLLLKHNAVYLPMMSLSAIIEHPDASNGVISYGRAAVVFACYLVLAWATAWYLFLRRDAN